MPLSIRLKEEQMERLEDLAKQTGRSKTYYVTQAIEMHLDELEMIYLAKQRSENIKARKSKTYTLNEVLERNGLSD